MDTKQNNDPQKKYWWLIFIVVPIVVALIAVLIPPLVNKTPLQSTNTSVIQSSTEDLQSPTTGNNFKNIVGDVDASIDNSSKTIIINSANSHEKE